MNMLDLLWTLPALLLLALGWFASAWWHERKLSALKLQIELLRRTAADHAQVARRQVAQLQAELESRPPLSPEERARLAARLGTVLPALPEGAGAGTAVDNAFAPTQVAAHGFQKTELLPRH